MARIALSFALFKRVASRRSLNGPCWNGQRYPRKRSQWSSFTHHCDAYSTRTPKVSVNKVEQEEMLN
eukprot:4688945-Amphidinium_carterae.1